MKDYPARVKEDNARFTMMQKAFVQLNKTHQANIKETQGLSFVI